MPDLAAMRDGRKAFRLTQNYNALGWAVPPETRWQYPDMLDGLPVLEWHGPPFLAPGQFMVLGVPASRPWLADAELGAV